MTRPHPSARWHARHVLHKQGVIGVTLATVLFLVGFSVPAWVSHCGLWMDCSSGTCAENVSRQTDAMMNTARVTECLALLAFLVCLVLEILQDCSQTHILPPYDKAVEALAFLAGILGITGAIVFASQTFDDSSQHHSPAHAGVPHQHDDHRSRLHWGFGLVITASIISLLSAVAIGYSRWRHGQCASYAVKARAKDCDSEQNGDEVSLGDHPPADSSSMMLVPAGHFGRTSSSGTGGKDPPPYALPPPYPYPTNCDFLLPIANSSMVPQITAAISPSQSDQATSSADQSQSFPCADGGYNSSAQSFITPVSAYQVSNNRMVMGPLFVKTDGGSEVEITPSAANSSGLPSPYNHF